MNLEDQLREALRRQDPPEGFAERVIQRTEPVQTRFQSHRAEPKWRFRLLWPAVSFATAALMLSVGVEYRRVQQERAGQQAILALRIVSEKLNMVRDKVVNK